MNCRRDPRPHGNGAGRGDADKGRCERVQYTASYRALTKRLLVYSRMPGGPLPMAAADYLICILRLQDA
jgi:hypothetical protein